MPDCQICGDVGVLRYEVDIYDPYFGKTYICACQQAKAAKRIQDAIGTQLDGTLFLKNIQERGEGSRAMKKEAHKFVTNPAGFLTIYGMVIPGKLSSANGNGKTTCLQAIVNECVLQGVAAVYLSASDLVEFLKSGIGDHSYDVESRLNVLCEIPVLCIDELSQPNWTDWVEDKFSTLINRRYADDTVGTVLALDDDPAEFLHRRIYSRLLEGVLVQNSDPDMRPILGGNHA